PLGGWSLNVSWPSPRRRSLNWHPINECASFKRMCRCARPGVCGNESTETSGNCAVGQKMVAGAGFEPAIPPSGNMSLTSAADRLRRKTPCRLSLSLDEFRVGAHLPNSKGRGSKQRPRPAGTSPLRHRRIVLFEPNKDALGQADVEAPLGIAQHINQIGRASCRERAENGCGGWI